jgi:hypothetical protein
VTPCSVAVGYQHFGGPWCIHLLRNVLVSCHKTLRRRHFILHPEDGSSKMLRNVSILPEHYAASQPRRPRLEASPPWKFRISHQGMFNFLAKRSWAGNFEVVDLPLNSWGSVVEAPDGTACTGKLKSIGNTRFSCLLHGMIETFALKD